MLVMISFANVFRRCPAAVCRFGVCLLLVLSSFSICGVAQEPDEPAKPSTLRVGKNRDEGEGALPKYEELILPTAEELLRAKPFDWIVLHINQVIVAEPISPRPDTLLRLQSELDRYSKAKSGGSEADELLREKRRQLQRIQLTMINPGDEENADYFLETKFIQKIEYFEDLVLRRANLLIDEGNIPLAYDLLLMVDQRNRDNNIRSAELVDFRRKEDAAARAEIARRRYTVPDALPFKPYKSWPKWEETYERLLERDADQHQERNDFEGTFVILENLWDHNSSREGLSDRIGTVADRLIAMAVDTLDFRKARHFLNRLSIRYPQHTVVDNWKAELTKQAGGLIEQARQLSANGDDPAATYTIEQAARVWPDSPGLKDAHRELTHRFQSVRLGVLRLPGTPTTYPLDPPAEAEVKLLMTQPLFEPTKIDERGVRYRSSLFETWEPTDLGREVQFNLRLKRADWEARPLVTAADVAEELAAMIDPGNSRYDERLAGAVERISVQSPSRFTIHFRRLPLRLESLLQLSIPIGESSLSRNSEIPAAAVPMAGRQRFYEFENGVKQVSYRRVRPQPASLKTRNVDEIVEVKYDSWDKQLQGLVRGEIVGITHVGHNDLKGLRDDNRFFVVPYAMPLSHFVLFNPASPALRDGQLRRAISLAIPRDEILRSTIQSNAVKASSRITTTPFPSNGYGHNRLLLEPAYDPHRAAALALTAKKQMGGTLPVLRIACPPDATIRAACTAMIEHWKRVGVEVELNNDSTDRKWDLIYKTDSIVEPVAELWPMLAVQNGATIESLKPLPERMRRQLVELERTNDWTSAIKLLRRIETELLVEARYIPLWEVDEFFVTRRNLLGLPTRLMNTFQDAERWTLQSWYPTEVP